ncbi:MAG: LicD family protein [Erysipelotrichaceae bacterium]|nr:LicD family protein [Erysipelotrichaceae bacterium]
MYSDDPQLKQLQQICLEIMKSFTRFCDENGLTYYMCGGTLLGAIRHQGFIPWDDDVDLAMPREDYEKLLKIADRFNGDRYQIRHYSLNEESSNAPMMQVVDTKATLLRQWTKKEKRIPVWIDVFPLDGMPRNKLLQKWHYYRYHICQYLMQISDKDNAINIRRDRGFLQRIFIAFIFRSDLGKNWDKKKLLSKMDQILMKYPMDHSEMISSFHGTLGKKEILEGKWYNEKALLPFEDGEYCAPKGYDAIMHHYYGDYMIPKRRNYEHDFADLQIEEGKVIE